MTSERSANAITALARLLVAAYMGALLIGPAPWGYPLWGYGWFWLRYVPQVVLGLLYMAIPFVVPAAIAGFLAGRRIGALAGLLAAVLTQGYWFQAFFQAGRHAQGLLPILLTVPFIYGLSLFGLPVLFGWLGGLLSSRLVVGRALNEWRHWRKFGLVAVLMLIYAFTLGKSVALHTIHSKFAKIWPSDTTKIRVWSAGVYPAVDGVTGCKGCGFPDTYYTDPTGLVFLYKRNLD